VRFFELFANPLRTTKMQLDMIERVVSYLMALPQHVLRQLWKPPHMVADHEKRRRHTLRGERCEYRWSGAFVRSIVEG